MEGDEKGDEMDLDELDLSDSLSNMSIGPPNGHLFISPKKGGKRSYEEMQDDDTERSRHDFFASSRVLPYLFIPFFILPYPHLLFLTTSHVFN